MPLTEKDAAGGVGAGDADPVLALLPVDGAQVVEQYLLSGVSLRGAQAQQLLAHGPDRREHGAAAGQVGLAVGDLLLEGGEVPLDPLARDGGELAQVDLAERGGAGRGARRTAPR